MSEIELFGTVTSPYVRRIRILLHELGQSYALIDTAAPAGQAALRGLNPVWKVPTLRIDGGVVFDSAVIARRLMQRFGPGPLAAFDPDELDVVNSMTVVDGALDALINVFYLGKEGISRQQTPYLEKQYQRASASLAWLEARVQGAWLSRAQCFGLPEIALLTSLDWMRFRDAYPIARHGALVEFLAQHAARASVATTAPPA